MTATPNANSMIANLAGPRVARQPVRLRSMLAGAIGQLRRPGEFFVLPIQRTATARMTLAASYDRQADMLLASGDEVRAAAARASAVAIRRGAAEIRDEWDDRGLMQAVAVAGVLASLALGSLIMGAESTVETMRSQAANAAAATPAVVAIETS
jgi:hypothetical protein